jgi:hypothetical protein
VEISTLTQHVVDERGGTHARLSEDSTALWLFNGYFLADDETYKQAIGQTPSSHVFDRIFLISGSRSVVTLYDKPA